MRRAQTPLHAAVRLLRAGRRATTTPEPAAAKEPGSGRVTGEVTALVYELLDAHADTADLAAELVDDPRWADHLNYLRALQRAGREALVRSSAQP